MPRLAVPFIALATVAALTAAPAIAHHGFTGQYDISRPIALSGVATAVNTAPPHPTVTIKVEGPASAPALPKGLEARGAAVVRAEDVGQIRAIEFPPIGQFFDAARAVKVGDRVEVIAFRNCRPPHQLRSQALKIADTAWTVREGRTLSGAVNGCPAR
jgi:hypothetical protein